MASISITVADADLTRALNAACVYLGYQDTINGSPNPETKAQFVRRRIAETVKLWAVQGEVATAIASAQTTAAASANQISVT